MPKRAFDRLRRAIGRTADMRALELARTHLRSLGRARRVLPGDPVIEREYARMEAVIRDTAPRP